MNIQTRLKSLYCRGKMQVKIHKSDSLVAVS